MCPTNVVKCLLSVKRYLVLSTATFFLNFLHVKLGVRGTCDTAWPWAKKINLKNILETQYKAKLPVACKELCLVDRNPFQDHYGIVYRHNTRKNSRWKFRPVLVSTVACKRKTAFYFFLIDRFSGRPPCTGYTRHQQRNNCWFAWYTYPKE